MPLEPFSIKAQCNCCRSDLLLLIIKYACKIEAHTYSSFRKRLQLSCPHTLHWVSPPPPTTLPSTLPPHWRLESFPWASVKCCVPPGRPCSSCVPMVCSNVCRSDRLSDLGWQGFYVVCLCDFRHKDNINSLLYSFVAWLKLMFLLYVLYRSLLHALSLWGGNVLFLLIFSLQGTWAHHKHISHKSDASVEHTPSYYPTGRIGREEKTVSTGTPSASHHCLPWWFVDLVSVSTLLSCSSQTCLWRAGMGP